MAAKFSKIQWGDGLTVTDPAVDDDDNPLPGVIRIDGSGGPAGATGPAGPTGPTGPTGAAGADGADGVGVPAGGTAGQVLTKDTTTDYDTSWQTPTGGGATGSAGGVLSGTYPNPGFAVDMATQAELDTATKRRFLGREYGPMPGAVGSTGMYRVPYFAGSSVTFTLSRASLHLETPGSTSSVLVIEKSSTADWFNPTVIATLTVASSSYSATDVTSSLGTLASGNLIRFRWTSLGTGAKSYHAQLEGAE